MFFNLIFTFYRIHNNERTCEGGKTDCTKRQTPTISDEGLLFWWAHLDSNQGPKDYEQL